MVLPVIVCLFVLVCACSANVAPVGSLCRPNERLLMCGCPKTCKDPAPNCEGVCRAGCYCEEGEVRNSDGICVKLADCPPIKAAYIQDTTEPRINNGYCPKNEEYRFCEPCGSKSCENPNPICPAQCNRGCFCVEGLLRNHKGQCVKPIDCKNPTTQQPIQSISCHSRQVYKRCEDCAKTCSNPKPVCPTPCLTGCFCEKNYVMAPDGRCVKLEDCPKATTQHPIHYQITCHSHQVYKRCEDCAKTCSNPKPVCPTTCLTGCFCEENYVMAPDGRCVKLEDCPKAEMSVGHPETPTIEDCAPDEEYFSCGWCEPSCSEPTPSCPNRVCITGCLCRPPLLRHHSGHCVERKDCLRRKCKNPNEEYVCRYGCELRCEMPRFCALRSQCVYGCHCLLGLYRDKHTGLCVRKEQCTYDKVSFKANEKVLV